MTSRTGQAVRAAFATCAAVLFTLSLTGTASAAARDGECDSGEFCLYYWLDGPYGGSSVSDFTTSIPKYGSTQPTCYEFKTPNLPGYQQCVKNNAWSAWNRTSGTVRLYIQESCEGAERWVIQPGEVRRDLTIHRDKNQSHSLASSGSC